tara:strand:+ start:343 stop:1452 length:1110 start_codon:yes stop_codon:yes gene_type:complete
MEIQSRKMGIFEKKILVEEKLISKKKPFFPISDALMLFLKKYDRWMELSVCYDDLLRFSGSVTVYDKNDQDSLWIRVFYSDSDRAEIDVHLKTIYTLLHSDGGTSSLPDLNIDTIDYCTFGNSKPFRIKIRNILNDNFTYFYVKKTDASRVYGLEFEHSLSPYSLNYMVNHDTLIEEHIAGIPGDTFIKEYLPECNEAEKAQIAKEYVKFNERCMVRLLGDMRAYNYVVIPIHDFDQVIYKIRAIDFDQQCYEGKLSVYRPQFFKENYPLMLLVKEKLNHESIIQYKIEERSIVSRRLINSGNRVEFLVNIMKDEVLSTPENLENLKNEIFIFTQDDSFKKSKSMGALMQAAFDYMRQHYQNVSLGDLL